MIEKSLITELFWMFFNIQIWVLVLLYAIFGLVLIWLAFKAGKEGADFVGDDQKIKPEINHPPPLRSRPSVITFQQQTGVLSTKAERVGQSDIHLGI